MPSTHAARIHPMIPVMILLAAVLAWHAGANTNTRPQAAPTTVATVDIVSVFERLNERPVLEEQLQARLTNRQAQVEEIRTRLRTLREDIQTVHTPGTDAYYERVREFTELNAVAEARVRALEQIISIDQGTLRRELYEKIRQAVTRIAERDGIQIVFFDDSGFEIPSENASNQEVFRAIVTKGVIYQHDSVDITDRVVTLMNNEYTAP